jgi:hypothetical protein
MKTFQTTRWTLVCSAKGVEDTVRASALEDLGTQEFFYRLLSKDYLQAEDREKGKFRTYLLVAMEIS